MFRHALPILAALSLLALPLSVAAQPLPPRQALVLEVNDAPQAFPSVDKDKKIVLVPQTPSRTDIATQTSDGSIVGIVQAIDLTADRLKIRTDLGQTVTLAMAYGDLVDMRIGEQYIFVVRPRPLAR
jgi:hypothetical protein